MRHCGIARVLQNKWAVILAWQVASLILCGAATLVTLMATQFEQTIPFLMMTLIYTFLFICSVWRAPRSPLSWWGYITVSALTILGDWTGILAYEKTSMASALMFLTTGVFWVTPLAYFVFHRKVTIWQVIAICLGVAGGALVVVAEGTEGDHWVGDLIALASVLCYSVLAIVQEYLIHSDSLHLYLFRFSASATPITVILTGAVEHSLIATYTWNWRSVTIMVAYGVAMALYDFVVPFVMQFSDATTMNLSLLTSNFFSLGISVLAFHQKASWLYLLGFFCVPIAITIFSLTGPKAVLADGTGLMKATDGSESLTGEMREPLSERQEPSHGSASRSRRSSAEEKLPME
jgi:drug/metabolite transporter (DMT)-like permease